jgi:hypothetical protein
MKEKPTWRDSGWFFEGHTLFVYIENTNVHVSEGVGSPCLLMVYYGSKCLCGVELRVRSFAKKFVCRFYMTILVVWSSLDHSKENSKGSFNKNSVIRRLRWFTLFFIWFIIVLPSCYGMIFFISITCVYSQINL